MRVGLDLLGMAKYPDIAIKCFPRGWSLGVFCEAFGDPFLAVEKLLQTGKCPHVRFQLLWSDSHSFGDKDIPRINKLGKRCEQVKQKFPGVDIEISTFCEHNLLNADKYHDITQSVAPSCVIVNTPWKGKLSNKYKNEVHGTMKPPTAGEYNYSFDGTASEDSDIELFKVRHKEADTFFLWSPEFNCRYESNDTTPRPQRKHKPSKELIESIVFLSTYKGDVFLPKKWLWKSHSENKGTGDKRANKPVLIAPIKTKEIVLKRNGKIIHKLPYYGRYEDGRSRYYASIWGYKLNGICEIWANGKQVGTVNPGFREGQYRA